ncbi:hypothetical protein [Ilumatobacter sp.]|uniref:hypothetical protein n=1 Tax=Ilumatobacter sp. TaxID=1967498 RepID=UPI003B527837
MTTTLTRTPVRPLGHDPARTRQVATSRQHRPGAPVWSPWADSRRPATVAEEIALRARLVTLSGSTTIPFSDVRRADVTAVLNALRCGASADELLARAPGLRPAALATACDELDRRRAGSAAAWRAIEADGSPDALDAHAHGAALLLPRLVAILDGVRVTDPASYGRVLAELVDSVAAAAAHAATIEARLSAAAPDGAPTVGRLLYEPRGDGLSNWPTHLPERLTTLSPARVGALLGERVEGTQLVSVRSSDAA